MTLSWVCAVAVQFIAMTAAPATAPMTLMRAAFLIMRASLDRMRFANTGRKILLVFHRGAHPRNSVGRRVGDLLDQGRDLLARERVDLDLGLVRIRQERRILHGGVEGAPERLDALRRHVRV